MSVTEIINCEILACVNNKCFGICKNRSDKDSGICNLLTVEIGSMGICKEMHYKRKYTKPTKVKNVDLVNLNGFLALSLADKEKYFVRTYPSGRDNKSDFQDFDIKIFSINNLGGYKRDSTPCEMCDVHEYWYIGTSDSREPKFCLLHYYKINEDSDFILEGIKLLDAYKLKSGDRVQFAQDTYSILSNTSVDISNLKGTVTRNTLKNGESCNVKMDKPLEGYEEWNNEIHFDDISATPVFELQKALLLHVLNKELQEEIKLSESQTQRQRQRLIEELRVVIKKYDKLDYLEDGVQVFADAMALIISLIKLEPRKEE